MEVNIAEARRKRKERGRKVRFLAQQWGITPRAVYMRIQKEEINLESVKLPEDWGTVDELPEEANGSEKEMLGSSSEAVHTSSTNFREWKELVSEQMEKIGELRQQMGELKERNQWLFSENMFLKKEIGLLKAPEEPVKDQEESRSDKEDQLKQQGPTLRNRIRCAWYGFTRGGLEQETEA